MGDKIRRMAMRTSLWYAFFAAFWMAASGGALAFFVRDGTLIEKIEIYKGWFFVAVTAFPALRRPAQAGAVAREGGRGARAGGAVRARKPDAFLHDLSPEPHRDHPHEARRRTARRRQPRLFEYAGL